MSKETNREMLRRLIVGGTSQGGKPLIYDLTEYGGFDLIVTKEDLSEEELREAGRRNSEKRRQTIVEFVQRFPSLCEDMEFDPRELEWVRDLVPESVRVKYEAQFA